MADQKNRKKERQEEAFERQAARAGRTDAEQLEILAARGITEGREVERLKARI